MTSKPWFRVLVLLIVFIGFALLLRAGGRGFRSGADDGAAPKNAILHLELDGVILNGKRFLGHIEKYADDQNIKAVVVSIDSPGGAVGPSQEINAALNRLRKDRKIPVICTTSGVMASGAYYSAVACDQIVVSAGALVGSIGVIMEFVNLEKLYDWAKISRSSITSGKFKDSGAEYRPMREDERALFQDLINEVYQQFKVAVHEGRPQLKEDVLTEYADGRVFTGAKAVELGFADVVGGFKDAVKIAADKAGLEEKDYELFKPPRPRRNLFDWSGGDVDPVNAVTKAAQKMLKLELANRPLYLMPGTWGETD